MKLFLTLLLFTATACLDPNPQPKSHWYVSFRSNGNPGVAALEIESNWFQIGRATKYLRELQKDSVIITDWKQLSKTQYDEYARASDPLQIYMEECPAGIIKWCIERELSVFTNDANAQSARKKCARCDEAMKNYKLKNEGGG